MHDPRVGPSPLAYARAAGLLYLIIFIAAPFAEFAVRQAMIIPGDPLATAANIRASDGLFRAAFTTDLTVFVIEVAQAALLYVLFAPVSRALALVMAFARLAQAAILGLNLLNMFTGLQLLTAGSSVAAFADGQLEALAYVFFSAHGAGYELGLMFFALHLGVLGYLVHRSGFMPRLLGHLLIGAALGYLANGLAVFLVPGLVPVTAVAVLAAAMVGELPLTAWLLIKGVDVDRWRERATRPAFGPVAQGAV